MATKRPQLPPLRQHYKIPEETHPRAAAIAAAQADAAPYADDAAYLEHQLLRLREVLERSEERRVGKECRL